MKIIFNFLLMLSLILNGIFVCFLNDFMELVPPGSIYLLLFVFFLGNLLFSLILLIKSVLNYQNYKIRTYLSLITFVVSILNTGICFAIIFTEYLIGPPA
ncbi:hypothetical protein [Metabacillus fastidiosus]|uniref:hypothetical protein n=1 Tax=Metabacillus fastidiosus TaxID=1458 RepID=UPI003D2E1E8E